MKKFLVMCHSAKGFIEIHYDEVGLLCYVDARQLIASSFIHCSLLMNIPLLHSRIKIGLPEDIIITEVTEQMP